MSLLFRDVKIELKCQNYSRKCHFYLEMSKLFLGMSDYLEMSNLLEKC